jgi:hypothetical protein
MGSKRWRPAETNRHRVATMTSGDNFGLVAIDWDRSPPRVSLQVHDVDGDVTIQQKLDLSLLQPGGTPVAAAGGRPPAAGPKATTPGAVTPAEAATRVNEKVTLEMAVKASGKSRGGSRVFLNSAGARDPDNFTVVLDMSKIGDALKAAGIPDPAAHFKGKTVRVTGTVSVFQEKPQIVVEDAGQVSVVEK